MVGKGEEGILGRLTELQGSLVQIKERIERFESQLSSLQTDLDNRLDVAENPFGGDQVHVRPSERAGDLDLVRVNEVAQKLVMAKSQEQILEAYLREARSYLSRVLLFLNNDVQYVPWKGIGFTPDRMESLTAEHPDNPIVRAARQQQIICRGDALEESLPWLREEDPVPGFLICIPLIFEDSVPVVFYGDASAPISIDSLELLTHLTTLVLKNHYLQYLIGRRGDEGRVEGFQEIINTMASAVPGQFQEDPAAKVAVEQDQREFAPVPGQPAPTAVESEGEDLESREQDEEEAKVKGLLEIVDKMASVAPDRLQTKAQRPPVAQGVPTESPSSSVERDQGSAASVWQDPRENAKEEKRLHDEAWRCARLLVDQIEVRARKPVDLGRRNKDLYLRLKDEIERSRKVYARQVAPKVAAQVDYFHRELVRILANGDETLLGRDDPGPSTGR